MRNANYYKSVVREYFNSDIEKYRDAFAANAQVNGNSMDENGISNHHECFCNFCGDDISSRSQNLA